MTAQDNPRTGSHRIIRTECPQDHTGSPHVHTGSPQDHTGSSQDNTGHLRTAQSDLMTTQGHPRTTDSHLDEELEGSPEEDSTIKLTNYRAKLTSTNAFVCVWKFLLLFLYALYIKFQSFIQSSIHPHHFMLSK